ncbi:TolC family protein [Maribellus sediminis]|uniref:TolC family protein n=1 Tax=Maribellus sediminis TaxID=2696285 RepID=UPI0014306519|nr:TolC family protein [Maribellus sediminis]
MLKNILSILVLSVTVSFNAAHAQDSWSLNDCISYAMENNLDIESQNITTQKYKEALNQSKRNRLPYVSAGTGYNISFGRSVDPNDNTYTTNSYASNSYSVNAGMPIFAGFIMNNKVAYNRFMYLAGVENEKNLRVEIGFQVMEDFHNALYYKGFLEIVKEKKELSELNLKKVQKQAEVGLSARTELLEIEARLADEELLVIRTENSYRAALLNLKRSMNFPVNEDLQLEDIKDSELIEYPVYENADSVFMLAMQFLPSVRAKMQQLNAVEKALSIAKGGIYPSLNLSGGYYTGYTETSTDQDGNIIGFKSQFKNNASQSVGVSLSVPIFNRWASRSEIKQQKLSLEKEKVDLENFKNQLYYEIESYCQDLSAVSAEYLQAKKQTESNQLAFEVAEKKKEQGMFNIIDFYASKNLLSNAQSELLRTKLMYLIKRKTLDFYMGKTIFQTEPNN